MKDDLTAQVICRTAYLVVALFALMASIGFWTVGQGAANAPDPFFFTDFFNWALVMSAVAAAAGLAENAAALSRGEKRGHARKFPLLRFCAASSMLFAFLLGAFFVDRVGAHRLTDTAGFGNIFPGVATAGYWLDLASLLPRFVAPIFYLTIFVLFNERMRTRPIYATLGILPPTLFYFFDMFYGMIMSAVYGGADKLVEAGMYGVAYPYFFQDSAFTYTGWWWIIIWPTIFGVSLMVLNNIVFRITRTVHGADGKLVYDKKTKPDEDGMCDIIHSVKVRRAAKKNAAGN